MVVALDNEHHEKCSSHQQRKYRIGRIYSLFIGLSLLVSWNLVDFESLKHSTSTLLQFANENTFKGSKFSESIDTLNSNDENTDLENAVTVPLTQNQLSRTGVAEASDAEAAVHQKLIRDLGCDTSSIEKCIQQIKRKIAQSDNDARSNVINDSKPLSSQELLLSHNVTQLLNCQIKDDASHKECLRRIDSWANFQTAQRNVLRYHIALAENRSQSIPKEHKNLLDAWMKRGNKQHPAFTPLNPAYVPKAIWRQTNYADINIVGMPKTGTSQMYKILSTHPQGMPYSTAGKEYCHPESRKGTGLLNKFRRSKAQTLQKMDSYPSNATEQQLEVQRAMYLHHKSRYAAVAQKREVPAGVQTVNGCLQYTDFEYNWYYLHLATTKRRKFIFLLRDPADWLWAVFNFWAQANLDDTVGNDGSWVYAGRHYRSPELFHELIASGTKTLTGSQLIAQRNVAISSLRRVFWIVGSKNVLVLRNEDLEPSRVNLPDGVLDKLSTFTGFNRTTFDKSWYSVVTNCNGKKGSTNACTSKSSAYAVAGGREMLPETRTLIYLQYWEECKMWSQKFGVTYPDCVNVMDSPGVVAALRQT